MYLIATILINELIRFLNFQLKLAVKHLDSLLNQYEGKLTEVIGKKAQQHSNGAIHNDSAASGKARMASQVGHHSIIRHISQKILLYPQFPQPEQILPLQLFALVPIFLLQFTYGMNTGFPAILTPQLAEEGAEFTITSDEESWEAMKCCREISTQAFC